MIRTLSIAALLALGATIAIAQSTGLEAIKERQTLMKAQSKALWRDVRSMAKGDKPYDQAAAIADFKAVVESSEKLKSLWPDDSKSGGDTRAQPKIWENKKDFMDWIDQVITDAKEVQGTVKDKNSLQAAYDKVNESCTGCHKDYRKPEEKK